MIMVDYDGCECAVCIIINCEIRAHIHGVCLWGKSFITRQNCDKMCRSIFSLGFKMRCKQLVYTTVP
jgi:hypothetical protein